MRKYWLYFYSSLMRTLTYRGQLLIFTLASLLSVVPIVAVWLSFGDIQAAGYSKADLISYYLAGLFIQRLIYSSMINYYIQEVIADGTIVGNFLTKPVNFFWATMALELGWLAASSIIGLLVTFSFAYFSGTSLTINWALIPVSLTILATLLAMLLVFSSTMIVGLISFWTVNISSFVSLYWIALFLLGGITLPLSFFPQFLQNFIRLNPFRFMFSFPLELLLGKISQAEIAGGFLLQILWIAFFHIWLSRYMESWEPGIYRVWPIKF